MGRESISPTVARCGSLILQVSVKGGDTTPFTVPLKQPSVLDLSRDGTELLVASDQVGRAVPLGTAGRGRFAAPRRDGPRPGAAFGADGASVIYGIEHDVYSVSLDGSSSRKVLTVDGTSPCLPIFAGREGPSFHPV